MEKRRGKIKAFNEDEEFPGYPKYAPSEDIMTRGKRIEGNLDDETIAQVKTKPTDIPLPIEKIDVPEGLEDKLMPKNDDEEDNTSTDLYKKAE